MAHYVTNESIPIFQQRMNLISTADPAFWTRCVASVFLHVLRWPN